MLDAIRKILGGKMAGKGTLTVQNEAYDGVGIVVDSGKIQFAGCSLDPLTIADVIALQAKNGSVSFSTDTKKYKFESGSSQTVLEKLKPLVSERTMLHIDSIEYYTYSTQTRRFEKSETRPSVMLLTQNNESYLHVEDDTSVLHHEQITTTTQYYMDQSTKSFVWSVFGDGQFHTFCIEFVEHLDFLTFSSKYMECCYRSVNTENEFKYFEGMANTVGTADAHAEEKDSSDEWLEYGERPADADSVDGKTNKHLVMGGSTAFVTRGSSLGVFDLENDEVKFRTHIRNALQDPKKIITHNQNQNLLVLENDLRDKLSVLDLERGEVVEKWDVKNELNDYFDSIKNCNDDTLVGVTDYSLIRIDPRLKEKIVEEKTYKTKNEFSCGIATKTGDVAVASRKGDLRLYDKIGKRAKSLLPGFGEEILGIDSSKDGSMILCTCKNYILVFNVNGDYSRPIGKDKPTPKRLQLKPQHLSLMKDEVAFTPAKFDQDDTVIVTSTGRFVVKWRVEDVKRGDVHGYSLKALHDIVVDENFVMNGEDIVVAMPNDVRKVTKQELRRPR